MKFIAAFILMASLYAYAEENFLKKKIKVGKTTLAVEIADTEPRRSQGLMFRKKLEPGHGMLFIFPDESPRGFWMKNTLIPLSIGYFDKTKKLIRILDMDPQPGVSDFDLRIYNSDLGAQYALEVPQGWFSEKKIKIGDGLEFPPK